MHFWGKKVLEKFVFFRPGRIVQNQYAHSSDGSIDIAKCKSLTAGNHEGEYLVYYDNNN